jgi:hypothetical protein
MGRRDRTIIALLIGGTLIYILPFLNPGWQIYEDAAILFRYAEHVSGGHGIVWNIGERPVDGATDLLFMWVLAGLHLAGIQIEAAARAASAVSHVVTVVIVYVAARRLSAATPLAAALSAIFVAVGPAKAYIAGGFGTPLFAMCVALMWAATLRLVQRPATPVAVLCGSLGVLAGIARPEGALLAVLVVISLFIYWRGDAARMFIWPIVATGVLFGGAYWAWRWNYFGYPLPNPFYRKGGGQIYSWNFLLTAKYGSLHIAPFLPAMVVGLWNRDTRRVTLLAALPLFGFLAAWILLSNEMNFFRRFQYPVVAIAAMSWTMWIPDGVGAAWGSLMTRATLQRIAAGAIAVVLLAATVAYEHRAYFPPRWQDDLFRVGAMLEPYHDRGYTVAISEAGLIPFYSKWNTIDVWGLNDQWIAHNGVVTAAYLDRRAPEVVIFRASCVPPRARDAWEAMVRAMVDYTRSRPYVLAARPHNESASIMYFVRSGFRDEAALESIFATLNQPAPAKPTPLPSCTER